MNLTPIETTTGKIIIINVSHIVSVSKDSNGVVISLSNGYQIPTKFDKVEYAIEYLKKEIERETSHSLSEELCP